MTFLFIAIVLFFVVRSFVKKKKKKELETFPEHWHSLLMDHVAFYKALPEKKQLEFQQRMMLFKSEIDIQAIHFELEELDQVLVLASAVIPVFGFSSWYYENLNTVLIYPDYFNESLGFNADAEGKNIAGMVGTGIYENKMILSRKALHHGFKNKTDKKNTAVHEFVHLIDKTDGVVDGIPELLMEQDYVIPWLKLIHQKMETINKNKSDIRAYGGTSETEFFAVAAEYFFERPRLMQRKHPELYQMLVACFQKREDH